MFSRHILHRATAASLSLALACGNVGLPASRAAEPSAESVAEEPVAKAPAPVGAAKFAGRVYASDGTTPVAAAVVRVRRLDDGTSVAATPTDEKGRFELTGLQHGYVVLEVEREGARFAGIDALSVPPKGRVAVDLTLVRRDERSASWWASRTPLWNAGGDGEAAGVVEARPELRGRDFWKTKKGIAVIASIGGAALLAIAVSSRNEPSNP